MQYEKWGGKEETEARATKCGCHQGARGWKGHQWVIPNGNIPASQNVSESL